MSRFKHFSDAEIEGLVDDVCYKLDRARELYGFPIIITCGYRSPEHNAKIGGVPNSAHTKGMAVDIRAPQDPEIRERLCWALGAAGFMRLEVAEKHFHADTDKTKPYPCFWIGEDR